MPPPDAWTPDLEDDPESELEADRCVVRGQEFFIRGVVRLPVLDGDDDLDLRVWVSVGADDFERAVDLWDVPGRETEPPYFGWLTTELPAYTRSTLHLKTRVLTRPPGVPSLIVLEPSDHPLAVEQREGITEARAEAIAARL
ncbi:DUF2199 domain-containing protein [Solirubrobacter phytolaccae]|uniref:DUF2199 domain-containing protein n=1 Tax=Solirubrobacter phytolaccae TaxID=1404360 RepID=A0A9X3SJ41_9ACTN|nr:DUF2199 domain-containing protein [Solirubrobacter phytolaccae]MDA0184832.1 DUF2199 domain-containing protein [Solirubrobacter phytolaccae]